MSLVGDAETAIGAATGTGWVRIALKLAPFVAIAALAIGLMLTRATLSRVKLEHQVMLAQQEQHSAEQLGAEQARVASASDAYAARIAALQPIIVRSTDTVRTYAETPSGHASCLGADRVRGLDELDASVAAGATASSAEPVPGDAGASPGGRDGDER